MSGDGTTRPLLRSLLPLMSQYCAGPFKLSRYVSLGLFLLPTVPMVGRRLRLPGIWIHTHPDVCLVTYFDIDYSVYFFDQRHRKFCMQVLQQERGLRIFLPMINVCLDLSFLSCFFASRVSPVHCGGRYYIYPEKGGRPMSIDE